jgi:hypothetical protein
MRAAGALWLHCDRSASSRSGRDRRAAHRQNTLALYDAVNRSWGLPPQPEGAEAQAPSEETAGPPPYVRYSAFQEEKEQD